MTKELYNNIQYLLRVAVMLAILLLIILVVFGIRHVLEYLDVIVIPDSERYSENILGLIGCLIFSLFVSVPIIRRMKKISDSVINDQEQKG